MKKIKKLKIGTKAYHDYFVTFDKIQTFFNFIISLVGYADQAQVKAHETLIDIIDNKEEVEKMKRRWETRISPVEVLSKHRQFFLEIILVRHVENYLAYLSAILFEIFVQRPETMKSNEKIDWETVLNHASINDLTKTLSEKKVETLSYKSFDELNKYFIDKFNVSLVEDQDITMVVDAIETRNISVHNRCLINHRYAYRTGKGKETIGKVRNLVLPDLEDEFIPTFARSVLKVDREIRDKLKIKGVRISKK